MARDGQARLRHSEARFRALVENSSDGVALIGADGLVQYVSRSIERVLGYSVEEFTGTSIFASMHPDDVPRVTALFGEVLQSPRTLITSQFRVRHKDGTYRDIEGTGEGTREPAAAGGHETVLLVEDEPTVRGLARRVLESQGYLVLEASNGRDAFALAAEYVDAIDLLLTDVVMPGISGRELVSLLQPLRPPMKVLYMSGYTDNTVERHGLLAPGVTFFPKPFTPAGLATIVRQTLDTTRSEPGT